MAGTTMHDFALERKAIGIVMLHPESLARAGGITAECFADERHGRTWDLVVGALLRGHTTSPEALMAFDRAEALAVGGVDMLQSYRQEAAPHITDPLPIFQRLHELYRWRQLDRIARHIQLEAAKQDADPEDILARLANRAQALLADGRETTRGKMEVAKAALDRALAPRNTITTGLTALDFMLQGGLQSRRLYGFGGVYGRGKTILLGSISDNLNLQGARHLFISMETDPEDVELRLAAKHFRLNAGSLSDPEHIARQPVATGSPTYLQRLPQNTWYEFCPGATMHEIHRMILRAKARHGIVGFMLDYWQLIEGRERGQSEEAHHRSNINRLAAVCRQEDLWGLVTAQIDEKGRLRYSDAMLQAAALYMRLVREEDGMDLRLEVEKSNYTRYVSSTAASLPGLVFDTDIGPHVREEDPTDAPALAAGENDRIQL